MGAFVCTGILVLSAGSLASYYRKEGFLNKGYLISYAEIAAPINRAPSGINPILIMDTHNTDASPLVGLLKPEIRVVRAGHRDWSGRLRDAMRDRPGDTIWSIRHTYDRSPARIHEKVEAELSATHHVRRRLFVPYSEVDRWVIRQMGWRVQPTHVLQLLEFREK